MTLEDQILILEEMIHKNPNSTVKDFTDRLNRIRNSSPIIYRYDMTRQTELLKKAVSEAFQIRWEKLLTRNRKYEVVLPRKIFMYLNQELLGAGCQETAQYFGFDHSTACSHKKTISNLISVNDEDVVSGISKVQEIFNRLESAV